MKNTWLLFIFFSLGIATANSAFPVDIQPIGDFAPPTSPRGLAASEVGGKITLEWDPSIDDITGTVVYRVYRDGDKIAEVSSTNFIDERVEQNQLYRYQVSGVDGAGNESVLSTPKGFRTGLALSDGGGTYVYPNPAVGGAIPVIRTEYPEADRAQVKIFDLSGRLVGAGEMIPASGGGPIYEFAWTDDVASGTYLGIVGSQGGAVLGRVKIAVVR